MVSEGKELVQSFRACIAPAPPKCGAKYQILVFAKRESRRLPVHFRSRSEDYGFLLFVGVLEDHLGAADVGLDGSDRTLHNQFDTYGGSQMKYDVGAVDQLSQHWFVH